MIDTEQFNKMKSTAYLINAGRGPIVNEQSLVKHLIIKLLKVLHWMYMNLSQKSLMH